MRDFLPSLSGSNVYGMQISGGRRQESARPGLTSSEQKRQQIHEQHKQDTKESLQAKKGVYQRATPEPSWVSGQEDCRPPAVTVRDLEGYSCGTSGRDIDRGWGGGVTVTISLCCNESFLMVESFSKIFCWCLLILNIALC